MCSKVSSAGGLNTGVCSKVSSFSLLVSVITTSFCDEMLEVVSRGATLGTAESRDMQNKAVTYII